MEKLKIVINGNKEIAEQAKDLFKILGYYITTEKRDNFYGWSLGDRCGDYYGNNLSFNEDPARLVTISELKDMVVLKRNNISDATHKSNINQMGYLTSNGAEYFWNYHFNKWNILKSTNFESEKLKPIKEEVMKESLNDKIASAEVARQEEKHSHYKKDVSHLNVIDPYRIADLYALHPCAEHIMKKSLCAGNRGHKDTLRDIQDIIDTAERWKQMIEEDSQTITLDQ